EDLSLEQKYLLTNLVGKRSQISFVTLEDQLSDIYVDEKYTIAASYRLLLPDLLPEYQKIIYIDCDMIVRNNLAKLYREIDLEGSYFGGVFEATLDFQLPHMKAID